MHSPPDRSTITLGRHVIARTASPFLTAVLFAGNTTAGATDSPDGAGYWSGQTQGRRVPAVTFAEAIRRASIDAGLSPEYIEEAIAFATEGT